MVVILLKLGMSFLEHAGGCTQPKSFFHLQAQRCLTAPPFKKKIPQTGKSASDRYNQY